MRPVLLLAAFAFAALLLIGSGSWYHEMPIVFAGIAVGVTGLIVVLALTKEVDGAGRDMDRNVIADFKATPEQVAAVRRIFESEDA